MLSGGGLGTNDTMVYIQKCKSLYATSDRMIGKQMTQDLFLLGGGGCRTGFGGGLFGGGGGFR